MRQITFETNFNSKLHADSFVHISLAPSTGVPESKAKEPIIICVADNKEVFARVELADILRLPFHQLRSIHTLPSHGMLCHEFAEWWCQKYPGFNAETEMAVYYYKKISDNE